MNSRNKPEEKKRKKIGDMKKIVSWLGFISFNLSVLFAQDVSIGISIEEPTIHVNDMIGIRITINGIRTNAPSVDLTTPSEIKEIPGASNTSSSISIVNGVTTVSTSELRTYTATKTGDFIVGPAKIVYNGKTYQSNKVSVKVLSADKKLPKENSNSGIDEYVFIRTIPSNNSVVVGQPIYIKYKLYFRTRITNLSLVQDVTATGALTEEYNSRTPNTRPVEEVFQGVQYSTVTIKEVIAYPQQSGLISFNPLILNLQAARPKTASRRSIFDDFLIDPFQEYATVNVSSQPLTINVKSISPTPNNYSGFVGKLSGKNTISKTDVKINEPISIKYTFEGTGNFKNFIPPKIQFPNNVEAYPPKEDNTIKTSMSGGVGKFSIEHIIVPRYSGDIDLPELSSSYYDLDKKSFQTITFKAQKIRVIGGSPQDKKSLTTQSYDFRTIGKDISFIQTETKLKEKNESRYSVAFYTFMISISAWVVVLGLVFYRRKIVSDRADVFSYAHKHAEKFAKKALEKAKLMSADQDVKIVLGEVHKVISQFVAHKAKLNESVWTVDELLGILKSKEIPVDRLTSIEQFLKKLNEYRFAPIQMIDMSTDQVLSEAEQTMANLSTYLS